MRRKIRAFSLVACILIFIQAFLPNHFATAADTDMTLDADVSGPALLNREYLNLSPTGQFNISLLPKGKAPLTERSPIDVVFVFDKSGSMNDVIKGHTKLWYAQQAMNSAISEFNANNAGRKVKDRFGLVAFDSDVSLSDSQLTLDSNLSAISAKVTKMVASGGTNYTQSLEKARLLLTQNSDGNNRKKHIIFLTDGIPTNSMQYEKVNGTFYASYTFYDMLGYFFEGRYSLSNYFYMGNDVYYVSKYKEKIDGYRNVYYDTNGNRNNIAIDNNGTLFLYAANDPRAVTGITAQVMNQAQLLKDNQITLNAIGFGNAADKKQLDMDLLKDMAALSKGTASNAIDEDIVTIFQTLSRNLSSKDPLFTNGTISFKLPDSVKPSSKDINFDSKSGTYYMAIKDIKYKPDPVSDQLQYTIPLTFSEEGKYTITFNISYGDTYQTAKTAAIEVKNIDLTGIAFQQSEITLKVGDKIELTGIPNNVIKFSPSNAVNQRITNVSSTKNDTVRIVKSNGKIFIEAVSQGYATVTATATDKQKTFDASQVIYVDENTDNGTGDTGNNGGPNDGSNGSKTGNYKW
ncbi:VWA domain-containing protein [Metabacillus sp. GX 13764]|uniref:VWA domain-containing protein n=1 Tax=Metabacillus kandeliae TaxID=2900151 RepID=UPI001E52C837|nr:VWA domain-containing protein [Metabacillus kandeliae]MCD7032901.1 VWA domain-containing protein [Metabacillus kandeliae]